MTESFDIIRKRLALSVAKGNPYATAIVDALPKDASAANVTGSKRKWMQARHDATVDTVQIPKNGHAIWAPANRTVDASRTTYVTLDGSRSDYAGCKVAHWHDDMLVVEDQTHVTIYLTV